jgi:hypothetical protein
MTEPAPPPVEREWGALVFVGGVWALLTVGALVVAVRSASPIPWIDDWDLVKPLTGEEWDVPPPAEGMPPPPKWQTFLAWLWRPYINHRIPLPRLLLLGIYKLNGGDFRWGPVINVSVLAATALGLLIAARRMRGRTVYPDAVFPLALLDIDNEVLFATLGVNLIPSTVFSCAALAVLLQHDAHRRPATVVLVGLLLFALGTSGSSGLAQVPPLALWLAYAGWRHWFSREAHGRRIALLSGAWAAAAMLYVPIYLWHLRDASEAPPSPGARMALRTSSEFLSMCLGPATGTLDPALASEAWERAWSHLWGSGPGPSVLGVGVALAILATAAVLISAWVRQPEERTRAAGLFLFLAGMGLFALGLGWGRAADEPGAGYASRYATYSAPLLFSVYFAWELYGPPAARRLVPMTLFAVLCALFVPNLQASGLRVREHVQTARAVEHDLHAGSPPDLLAERYATFLLVEPEFKDHLTDCMRLLHQRGMGIFRYLQDPPHVETSFPVRPAELHDVVWNDGFADCRGDDPYLVFRLTDPADVLALRVRCRYEKSSGPVVFQALWKGGEQHFSDDERSTLLPLGPDPGEQNLLILVNARIDAFRLDPDGKPCVVRIEAIELVRRAEPGGLPGQPARR